VRSGLQFPAEVALAIARRAAAVDPANEAPAQAALLRCVFGNPFRPASVDAAALRWNDGVAIKIATHIYDARDFNRLYELADCLEDAGCTDGGLLAHLRSPGPHVRGCWAVDLVKQGN
jgi:hypothetical protein